MPYQRLHGECTVRSVANYTRRDAQEFLQLAAEIPVRSEVETLPLSDANQALRRLKRAQIRGSVVLTIA